MSTSLLLKPGQVRAKNSFDSLPKNHKLFATLDVEWDPVLDATSYVVDVAEESWLYPFAWTSYEVSGSTTSFSIPDLKHYSPYCVRVTARTASETLVGDLTRNVLTLTCEDDCMVLRHQHEQHKQELNLALNHAKDKIRDLEHQVQELTLVKHQIQELEYQVQALKRPPLGADKRQRIRSAQILNKALETAALTGRMDLVLYFVEKGTADGYDLDWDGCMEAALEGNHGDLVHYFIEKGAKDWNRGLMTAIEEGYGGWLHFPKGKPNQGNFSWTQFFVERTTKTNYDIDWRGAIYCAAKQGTKDLVIQLANACVGSDQDIDWENALYGAAEGGHQDVVKYLVEHFEPDFKDLCCIDWGVGINGAALGGHRDLVMYFIEKADADGFVMRWNDYMCSAAEGGHQDLVEYCIEKGTKAGCAMDWNQALFDAIENRHIHLFELFIEKGADDWNGAVWTAAQHGHEDIVEYFVGYCAKTDCVVDWSEAMCQAALGGHLDLVEYCVGKGSEAGCVMNWNLGMCFAAYNGDMDVVGYFIDKGANDWKGALLHAQNENHVDLVAFFEHYLHFATP